MRRLIAIAAIVFLVSTAGAQGVRADIGLSAVLDLFGNVTIAARPVENVLVVAFNLSSNFVTKTFTDRGGSFRLPSLPPGVYRIIAIKQGFAPAVVTVAPTRRDQQISLKLTAQPSVATREQIWEVRRALPPDVLRELNLAMPDEVQTADASEMAQHFRTEMSSMAAIDAEQSAALAQTAVGIRGTLPRGWQVNVNGRMNTIDDTAVENAAGPLAQSSGVEMKLQSDENDTYRVASVRNRWRLRNDSDGPADIESHDFEWHHRDANVQVRYLAQENVFDRSGDNSQIIELSGGTRVFRTDNGDVDVSLRVSQQSFDSQFIGDYRMANLTSTAHYQVIPAVQIDYGFNSRFAPAAAEWSPETGAHVRIAGKTSLVASAAYKISRRPLETVPVIAFFNDTANLSPKYRYSFGIVSGDPKSDSISAIATVAAIDSVVRMMFDDRFEHFWDGFYLSNGDVYSDVTVTVRKNIGNGFAVDVSSSAGEAKSPAESTFRNDRHYVAGTLQSMYRPSGTSLDISYRHIVEQNETSQPDAESQRLNVRVAQSLHLPLDLRVLVGFDLARIVNSHVLVDSRSEELQRRLVGGLAIAF